MRYFVDYSSWFDSHRYDTAKIKKAVRLAGGHKINTSYNYGWSNQPKVVTFSATPSQSRSIEKAVGVALGTQHIHVRQKNW